ncbi:MAG: ABC-2 family transporter protein, partial [Propionibacteriaceae bacterium]
GTLDVLLTRPTSVLLQLIAQDFQLRRLGRAVTGLVLYLTALAYARVTLTPAHLTIIVLAPIGAALIFSALFLFAAGALFYILDGNQAVNTFTYGSRYAAGVPGAALMTPIKIFFTFVAPATLIAYVPAAVLTDSPLPAFWWPGWAYLTVPLGLGMWALMLLWWRKAITHYTGAGG